MPALFPLEATMNPIERVTGAIATIDTNHGQIHAGNAFSLSTGKISIAAAAVVDLTFTIPEDVYVHFQQFDVTTDGGNELTITLFDETVLNATPAGTLITPINRNRQGHGKRAFGILTFAGVVTNNDTVTIGDRTYTFKSTLTGAANEILIGANAPASVANIVAAINAASGAGTTYGTGTVVNADVFAYDGPGDTVGVVAKARGTASNSIATTETLTNAASIWGAATLTGGADPTVSSGSSVTVRQGPTIDYVGYDQLDTIWMPKPAAAAAQRMEIKSEAQEWNFKNARTTTMRLTNTGTSTAVVVCVRPLWYEEVAA